MINWNSCKDVMPNTVGEYLVWIEYPFGSYADLAYISDGVFIVDENPVTFVTYWSVINQPDNGV